MGIFGVIITQLVIYIVGGWATYRWALHAKITASFMHNNQIVINKILGNLVNVNLVFLILGVIIYTILAAFSGALVAKPEDSSKAAQGTTMLSSLHFSCRLRLLLTQNKFCRKYYLTCHSFLHS
ncbi:hypothetical protein SDC49_04285 [Lactobacillus sp. R2/2]|nr:hypothetical protein [Lactobacillus sp. R2/2]